MNKLLLSPSEKWARGPRRRHKAERHCSLGPTGFRTPPASSRARRRLKRSSRRPPCLPPGQRPVARPRTPHDGRHWGTGGTPAEGKTCPGRGGGRGARENDKILPKKSKTITAKKKSGMDEIKKEIKKSPKTRRWKRREGRTGVWLKQKPPFVFEKVSILRARRAESEPQFGTSRALWCVRPLAGAPGCGADWLIGSRLLQLQAPPLPGARD